MEKKLLLEINRINDIIGVKSPKTLINEDNPAALILKKGVNFFIKNLKKVPNENTWTIGNVKIGDLAKRKLLSFLEGRIDFNSLSKLEAYYLGKIISQDTDIIDDLFNDIMENFLKQNPDSNVPEILEMIADEAKTKGISIKQVLESIIQNPNPSEKALRVGLLEDIIPKKINTLSDVYETRRLLSDIPKLTKSEIDKLASLNAGFKGAYRKFLDDFNRQFSIGEKNSISNLTEETLKLVKALKEGNEADYPVIAKRLNDNLKLLSQKDREWIQTFEKWVSGLNMDYATKNKIQQLPGYQKALSLFSKDIKEFEEAFGTFSQRRKNLRIQLNSLLNPASWLSKTHMKKWDNSILKKWKAIFGGKEFKELREDFYKGSTLSRKGYVKLAEIYGWPKAALAYTGEVAWTYFTMSLLLAIVDFTSDVLFGWINVQTGLTPIDNFLANQRNSFGEHFAEDRPDELESATQNLVLDMVSYVKDELVSLQGSMPGGIDDAILLYNSFIDIMRNKKKLTNQDLESFKTQAKKVQDSLITTTKQLKQKIAADSIKMSNLNKKMDSIINANSLRQQSDTIKPW